MAAHSSSISFSGTTLQTQAVLALFKGVHATPWLNQLYSNRGGMSSADTEKLIPNRKRIEQECKNIQAALQVFGIEASITHRSSDDPYIVNPTPETLDKLLELNVAILNSSPASVGFGITQQDSYIDYHLISDKSALNAYNKAAREYSVDWIQLIDLYRRCNPKPSKSPLHLAIEEMDDPQGKELRDLLGDSNENIHSLTIKMREAGSPNSLNERNNGETPLMLAIRLGKIEMAKFLAARGDVKIERADLLKLMEMKHRDSALIQIMLKRSSAEVINAQDGKGYTLLHLAIMNGDEIFYRSLLECKDINLNLKTNYPAHGVQVSETPLHLALRNKDYTAIYTLITAGANLLISGKRHIVGEETAEDLILSPELAYKRSDFLAVMMDRTDAIALQPQAMQKLFQRIHADPALQQQYSNKGGMSYVETQTLASDAERTLQQYRNLKAALQVFNIEACIGIPRGVGYKVIPTAATRDAFVKLRAELNASALNSSTVAPVSSAESERQTRMAEMDAQIALLEKSRAGQNTLGNGGSNTYYPMSGSSNYNPNFYAPVAQQPNAVQIAAEGNRVWLQTIFEEFVVTVGQDQQGLNNYYICHGNKETMDTLSQRLQAECTIVGASGDKKHVQTGWLGNQNVAYIILTDANLMLLRGDMRFNAQTMNQSNRPGF